MTVAGQGALGRALQQTVEAAGHDLVGLWCDPRAGDPVRGKVPTAVWPAQPPSADLLLLGDFGRLVSAEERSRFDVVVNAHWSLLPLHRGRAPAAAAILAGDVETGLTLHTVTDRVDAGRCLDQVAFPLGPRATRTSVYLQAASRVAERLPAVLDRLPEVWGGELGEGTLCPVLTPSATRLRWDQPAELLDRWVRATTAPAAWFVHRGRGVRVSQARFDPTPVSADPGRVVAVEGRRPVVATGLGTLHIERAWVPWAGTCWPWPGLRLPRVGESLVARSDTSAAGRD